MRYESGFVLFAAMDDDSAVDAARDHIKKEGWSGDDVKIVRREGMICVVVR